MRERGNRIKCAANLRSIGQAIAGYMSDHGQKYPRSVTTPFGCMSYVYGTGNNGILLGDDQSAAYYLLIRKGLSPSVFLCPNTEDVADPLAVPGSTKRLNFTSTDNMSFGFAPPYGLYHVNQAGYRLGPGMSPQLPLGGDRHSGEAYPAELKPSSEESEQRKANSPNHKQEGQNVLFADGHVSWCGTVFAGINQDDIYRNTKGEFDMPPQHKNDAVLTPTRAKTW